MSKEQNTNGKPQDDEAAVEAVDSEQVEPETATEKTAEGDSDLSNGELAEACTDEQKIELLANELSKAREDVLRAQAEVQNSRRRSATDVEQARKFALKQFVGDLLPPLDNLDRALEAIDHSDETFQSVVEGIELTRQSFLDALTRNQVVQIDPAGEPFDPEIHQAMKMVPNPDLEPNTVMKVFQKGYSLNDRLIRPAMVEVSKSTG